MAAGAGSDWVVLTSDKKNSEIQSETIMVFSRSSDVYSNGGSDPESNIFHHRPVDAVDRDHDRFRFAVLPRLTV